MTVVSAEPAQLQQVVLNLCNNAAQAMDQPGTIEIRIEVRETSSASRVGRVDVGPGSFVVISISDPGRGMDDATLERIFEPFFTTRAGGNGLGLATVREIVQQHEGAVGVESIVGSGTRFDIWLPKASSKETITVLQAPGTAGRGFGETVLVLRPIESACCGMRRCWPHSDMSRSASRHRPRLWRPAKRSARGTTQP